MLKVVRRIPAGYEPRHETGNGQKGAKQRNLVVTIARTRLNRALCILNQFNVNRIAGIADPVPSEKKRVSISLLKS